MTFKWIADILVLQHPMFVYRRDQRQGTRDMEASMIHMVLHKHAQVCMDIGLFVIKLTFAHCIIANAYSEARA